MTVQYIFIAQGVAPFCKQIFGDTPFFIIMEFIADVIAVKESAGFFNSVTIGDAVHDHDFREFSGCV